MAVKGALADRPGIAAAALSTVEELNRGGEETGKKGGTHVLFRYPNSLKDWKRIQVKALHVDEGTLMACLQCALRTADAGLGDLTWRLLEAELRRGAHHQGAPTSPSASAYQCYINLKAECGDLEGALELLPSLAAHHGAAACSVQFLGPLVDAMMRPDASELRARGWQDALAARVDAAYFAVEALHGKSEAEGHGAGALPALALVIAACCRAGYLDKAFQTFEAATSVFGAPPSVAMFNALISGCLENGRTDTTPILFNELTEAGLEPDAQTLVLMTHSALISGDILGAVQHLAALRAAEHMVPDHILEKCTRIVCRHELSDREEYDQKAVHALREHLAVLGFPKGRRQRVQERLGRIFEVANLPGEQRRQGGHRHAA